MDADPKAASKNRRLCLERLTAELHELTDEPVDAQGLGWCIIALPRRGLDEPPDRAASGNNGAGSACIVSEVGQGRLRCYHNDTPTGVI